MNRPASPLLLAGDTVNIGGTFSFRRKGTAGDVESPPFGGSILSPASCLASDSALSASLAVADGHGGGGITNPFPVNNKIAKIKYIKMNVTT
jgi:hypothetical protein